jgi:hypothetical protein
MPAPKLFAWSASLELPVMLCAFEDRDGASKAWHVAIEPADLRRLANQA